MPVGYSGKLAVKWGLDRGNAHRQLYSRVQDQALKLFNEPRRRSVMINDFDHGVNGDLVAYKDVAMQILKTTLEEHREIVRNYEERTMRQHADVISMFTNDV